MAEPSCADSAISLLKSGLRDKLVRVCRAEQRSRVLSTLLRLKLLPKDVSNFVRKQLNQQKNLEPRGLGEMTFNSGKQKLLKKIADSNYEERKYRRERDVIRRELEAIASKNVYVRIMNKLKTKVDRVRLLIKERNSN